MSPVATTMRASMLTAARTIERRVIAVPEVGPHELLVRVAATGVCGSDLATYRGTHPYKTPPVVLGHELCGVVERTGAEVSDMEPGATVCSAAFSHCERCPPCLRGAINLCHARRNLCLARSAPLEPPATSVAPPPTPVMPNSLQHSSDLMVRQYDSTAAPSRHKMV